MVHVLEASAIHAVQSRFAVVHLHHSLVKSYTHPAALELSDLILMIPGAHPEEKVLGGDLMECPGAAENLCQNRQQHTGA